MLNSKLSLLLSCCAMLFVSACSVSVNRSSRSSRKSVNFDGGAPIYHVYKVAVNIDTREVENYNYFAVQRTPDSRISVVSDREMRLTLPPGFEDDELVQKVPGSTKGSIKAFIASEQPLTDDQLLDLSARALQYRGQKVFYNARKSKIPVCQGMLTGFEYVSSEVTGRPFKVKMRANMSEGQGLCLIKAEVIVPSRGVFTLNVNGKNLVKPKMSGNKRLRVIESWEDGKSQDKFSVYAPGVDQYLRKL